MSTKLKSTAQGKLCYSQIEDYFKFRAYHEPGFSHIYVSYSWYGIHKSHTIGDDDSDDLIKKLWTLITDEFVAIYERNRIEADNGVYWSWVTTKEKTYLFREPSSDRIEMATLNIKIFDFSKQSEYLKSKQFENMLAEHSKKTIFVFEYKISPSNRNWSALL